MSTIVDLFCGAGGASEGYRRAFGPDVHIIGVDIAPQPRYPFDFRQYDAMRFLDAFPLDDVVLVHASPPCHDHSTVAATTRNQRGDFGTGWMLEAITDRLRQLNIPWVVENVQGAKMPQAPCEFRLCGSSFLMDIRRHRKFISNVQIEAPPCAHGWQTPRFTSLRWSMRKSGQLSPVVGVHGSTQYPGDRQQRERAMGIDWMSLDELNESIPPAFTEWIGKQLLDG